MSQYFKRSEFACKCGCGFDTVDFELVELLEKVREFFGSPVTVTSGCRCETYNKSVGGSKASQHLRGRAADIQVKHIAPKLVHEFLLTLNPGGLGAYDSFTHVDTRHGKARWGNSV